MILTPNTLNARRQRRDPNVTCQVSAVSPVFFSVRARRYSRCIALGALGLRVCCFCIATAYCVTHRDAIAAMNTVPSKLGLGASCAPIVFPVPAGCVISFRSG